MRLRNVKNKAEILENSKYLVKNPDAYKGKWRELFGNDNPIYIEIGMGKGQFIINSAMQHSNINYIGIEKYDSVMAKSIMKVPDGIKNLFLVRADALDIDNIFDKEIDMIYLNFSDPWPKNRHHLRRLSSRIFLDKYDNIFRKKMNIEMRTDNSDLFAYSLVSYSQHGYLLDEVSLDLHKNEAPKITTEYEDKFSRLGMPIYYIKCSKG